MLRLRPLGYCAPPLESLKLFSVAVSGHDSAEDALTCMDLMKLRIKQDIKRMIQLQKKQNSVEV